MTHLFPPPEHLKEWTTTWPDVLAGVAPAPLRDYVGTTVQRALEEFANDRLFGVERKLDQVLEFLRESPSSDDDDDNDSSASISEEIRLSPSPASLVCIPPKTRSERYKQRRAEKLAERGEDAAAKQRKIAEAREAAIAFLQNSGVAKETRHKTEESRKLKADLDLADKSWQPVRVDGATGFGTYYRSEPGINTHSFRVIGSLKGVDFLAVIGVILELDLFKEWFPLCSDSVDLGGLAFLERCARVTVGLPWPLAKREVMIHGYGVDDLLENKCAYIIARSMHEAVGHIACPDPDKNIVRMEMHRAGYYLAPVGPDEVSVSFIVNVDPKVAVPMRVLNFIASKSMWVLTWQMERAVKRAMMPESHYAERRDRSKKEIYDVFRLRLKELTF